MFGDNFPNRLLSGSAQLSSLSLNLRGWDNLVERACFSFGKEKRLGNDFPNRLFSSSAQLRSHSLISRGRVNLVQRTCFSFCQQTVTKPDKKVCDSFLLKSDWLKIENEYSAHAQKSDLARVHILCADQKAGWIKNLPDGHVRLKGGRLHHCNNLTQASTLPLHSHL